MAEEPWLAGKKRATSPLSRTVRSTAKKGSPVIFQDRYGEVTMIRTPYAYKITVILQELCFIFRFLEKIGAFSVLQDGISWCPLACCADHFVALPSLIPNPSQKSFKVNTTAKSVNPAVTNLQGTPACDRRARMHGSDGVNAHVPIRQDPAAADVFFSTKYFRFLQAAVKLFFPL